MNFDRYKKVRKKITLKQKTNHPDIHHPQQKITQINKILKNKKDLSIIEFFAGHGNLTPIYSKYGSIESYDKNTLKTGDSFILYHKMISEKRKFDVIDLDPYGFPNRFFPDIFLLLKKNGYIFITMPKPYINILNTYFKDQLNSYYNNYNPDSKLVKEKIIQFAMCHRKKLKLKDEIDLGRLWRYCFKCT
jgi:5-bromo-4-chloroindolyl phosphate hydrolysis protein